jgi:hypothetical protein
MYGCLLVRISLVGPSLAMALTPGCAPSGDLPDAATDWHDAHPHDAPAHDAGPRPPPTRALVTTEDVTSGRLYAVPADGGPVELLSLWSTPGDWNSGRGVSVEAARVYLFGGGELTAYERDRWSSPVHRWAVDGAVEDVAECGGLVWVRRRTTPPEPEMGRGLLNAFELSGAAPAIEFDLGLVTATSPPGHIEVVGSTLYGSMADKAGALVFSVDCDSRALRARTWPASPGAWVALDGFRSGALIVVGPQWWNGATEAVEPATLSRLDPREAAVSAPFLTSPMDLVGVATDERGWTAASEFLYGGMGLSSGSGMWCVDPSDHATEVTWGEGCSSPSDVIVMGGEAWTALRPCGLGGAMWARIARWRLDAGCEQRPTISVTEDQRPRAVAAY